MTEPGQQLSWREIIATALLVLLVGFIGSVAAFAIWLQNLSGPQIAILGSGNRLSLLVIDGPARLVIATGDDPIDFENALTRVRPIFARRIDVLLAAGSDTSLLVPLEAHGDRHVRTATALAPLPPSPESEAFGAIPAYSAPRRIHLGPAVDIVVETAFPFGADPTTEFPAWRATITHGQSRVVVFSDGEAAGLFLPGEPASVLVVSGNDPIAAWDTHPAVALVANADAVGGPEMREALAQSRRPPEWMFRVFPGEALRLRFIPGGVEIPSESAMRVNGG
ncbi:MAG: hypothetical protein ACRDJC_14790 [Thermomicrobiales bacterium]